MTDLLDVALMVASALETWAIVYTVGGSVASSIVGEPRASIDADILVAMTREQVPAFLSTLGPDFYADADAIGRAITRHGNVNLIHIPSSIKVDLFFPATPLDLRQLERRRAVQVASTPPRFLFVHSPEDILLQKLVWYRSGGEVSERQWRDVLSICLVQGDRLDSAYLVETAVIAGVSDLLQRALAASS